MVAPGSGVFYSAGRTLAAPSKASMMAKLLEEWASAVATANTETKKAGGSSSAGGGAASSGGSTGAGSTTFAPRGLAIDRHARKLVHQWTMGSPLSFASIFRKLEAGVPCK